jgi:hypothetical protein
MKKSTKQPLRSIARPLVARDLAAITAGATSVEYALMLIARQNPGTQGRE